MNNSTTTFRTRVPARRLQRAEKILHKLALTPADAVSMLLARIEMRQELPFEVSTRSTPLLSPEEQTAEWNSSRRCGNS